MFIRKNRLIVIRGAGDLASGVARSLVNAGFPCILLETAQPSSIRRLVCFSEAVYKSQQEVEGLCCKLCQSSKEARDVALQNGIALLIDPAADSLHALKPWALIDAILAKRNLGTRRDMAPVTIGLGPGFCAGRDVDAVIETNRGHFLGRIILDGEAEPNSGIPGNIAGYGRERVIRSQTYGTFKPLRKIGDLVSAGEIVAEVYPFPSPGDPEGHDTLKNRPEKHGDCTDTGDHAEPEQIRTVLSGVLRGILPDGYPVRPDFKCGDVDPRPEAADHCDTISDKARNIAGSVLEALLYFECRQLEAARE